MKFYCVRHGDTVSTLVDPDRPLSEAGRAGIVRVARSLKKAGIILPHLIHSPKLRAQQTAQIIVDEVGAERTTETKSKLDDTDSAMDWATEINLWEEDTMMIGHLPFISQLISQLLLQDEHKPLISFVPGTVVCLQKSETRRWYIQWTINPDIYTN
ncbi:MAG TPA: phosphohistidine phosphatase SixA [Coxiellaceae bacterium]|nr:phosphohistidine phosphatase SixA [Coxiellaceae bacterium]